MTVTVCELENGPVETVDLAIENGYVNLPDGIVCFAKVWKHAILNMILKSKLLDPVAGLAEGCGGTIFLSPLWLLHVTPLFSHAICGTQHVVSRSVSIVWVSQKDP